MESPLFSRRAFPLRAFLIASVVSVILMITNRQHSEWFEGARRLVHLAFDPIYRVANYPALSVNWLNQQAKSQDVLQRQNTAMQAELFQARARLQKLAELSAENARLRGLLNTPLIMDGKMLLSEVIGTDSDPMRHILVVNRGSTDGVFEGQTVLDDHGVMGQVLEVYSHSSRVLLISDKEHAASVLNQRTGMRGILQGTGDSGQLNMNYVPTTADIKPGDTLITSGLGNRFPAGYQIAIVTTVRRHGGGEFADISAKPTAQLEGGHYALLLFSAPLSQEQPYGNP